MALGGAIGTGVREALSLTWPAAADGFPVTVFAINVVGAFVLGLLLEALSRLGPDEGRRRILRLFVGTGVLGGFTTYSALATDVATRSGSATPTAFAYAALSLVVGVLAAGLGVTLAGALAGPVSDRHHRHGATETEEDAG